MRARTMGMAVAAAALAVVSWPAGPARADVTTPPGKCVATATFTKGTDSGPFTVDSRTLQPGEVVTVPLADTVSWTGEIVGAVPESREMSGYVAIELPWPFGTLELGSWSGTSSLVQNQGVDDYDLPAATPRGVELQVHGQQRENGAVLCTGTATVEVEGSPFASPATFVSMGGLALSGVALFAAGRAKYRSVT